MIVNEHYVPRSKKPPIFCKFQTLLHSQALATSVYDNERTCQEQLAATTTPSTSLKTTAVFHLPPLLDLSRRY